MPPSPALRYSPGREVRVENHKRGRSLEGGLVFKEKDDDLALFNEMQSKERENFLLQSSDDFEDTFSTKLKNFSDFKLGISIPARGESSELLNADGEKNDYDWLLTPPDTPLFPSLDDEPQPVNVAHRGRPRSKPITISRSSTMEKSYRSSRGSASPNRLSPSPRSGSSTLQSRGRPSSAPRSSPTPSVRSATPTRRPSPPPSKPATPAPRSSTPTSRRISPVSSSLGIRGTSPIRTSRGNSVSPKIKAWQSNIPGFSSDAPPNLRTSLADRPASYVRGSSPASRNGRDSASRVSRQSMSPTASRSVSSSHSHDRDRFSAHSKGSVASSGDDDVDSIQSVAVGSLDRAVSKRVGAFPNNRALAFSKKSTKMLSPSSAPKRSFDSALRQMDHRKSPQNMFRPLLSSVPSSTFYVGKSSSAQRSLVSRNSSVTTSSNASSDQGTSVALDTEGSDHHQDDVVGEFGKTVYLDAQEEVFAFDKMDILNRDVEHERHDSSHNTELGDFDKESAVECHPGSSDEVSHHVIIEEIGSTSDPLHVMSELMEVGGLESMVLCMRCGCQYRITEPWERGINLCPDCFKQNDPVAVTVPDTTIVAAENSLLPMKISEESRQSDELNSVTVVSGSPSLDMDMVELKVLQLEGNVKQEKAQLSHNYSRENSLSMSLVGGGEHSLAPHQQLDQFSVQHILPDGDTRDQQLQQSDENSLSKVDTLEGTGISILLNRPSSVKGPVVQGRTFIATPIPYEDLSYARDSAGSFRSSIGHGSASASSSVDFGSAKHIETRMQRQFSGRKFDWDNYRHDRPQSVGTSSSGVSNHVRQASGPATSSNENFEVSVDDMEYQVEEMPVVSEAIVLENKETDVMEASLNDAATLEEDISEHNESSRTTDASTSELSTHTVNVHFEGSSAISFPNYEDFVSHENKEDFANNTASVFDVEVSATPRDSSFEEDATPSNSPDRKDVAEVPAHSSLATISEIEIDNGCQDMPDSQIDDNSSNFKSNMNESEESSVPAYQDAGISDHAHGILEDSTVMVECRGRSKSRSLTLEEATDTILFCSSIVHDLAYQAATVVIEKESSKIPLEVSRPTVTVLGRSNSDKKDPRSRTAGKRHSKSLKARQRRVETDTKHPSSKTENNENIDEPMIRNVGIPNKADSMKPPKLESKCNCTIM